MKSPALLLLLLAVLVAAAAAAIIQPRPVDNRRDPHDGEPFEWEPVDDDPWPGPSFTFPRLPGIDDVDSAGGSRPPTLAEARVRAAILMQLLRAVFNNRGGDARPVASNEVLPSRQRVDKQRTGLNRQ